MSLGSLFDSITNEWKEDKIGPVPVAAVAAVAAAAVAAPAATATVVPIFIRDQRVHHHQHPEEFLLRWVRSPPPPP